MAGKKRYWVNGHWRSAPNKKTDEGYGLGVWLVGVVAVTWFLKLGPFRG